MTTAIPGAYTENRKEAKPQHEGRKKKSPVRQYRDFSGWKDSMPCIYQNMYGIKKTSCLKAF